MKRLDQGHLYPLLEHPETNMSRPGIEPWRALKQRAIRTAYAVAIWHLYTLSPIRTYVSCYTDKGGNVGRYGTC
jgi:hypothetical protein